MHARTHARTHAVIRGMVRHGTKRSFRGLVRSFLRSLSPASASRLPPPYSEPQGSRLVSPRAARLGSGSDACLSACLPTWYGLWTENGGGEVGDGERRDGGRVSEGEWIVALHVH